MNIPDLWIGAIVLGGLLAFFLVLAILALAHERTKKRLEHEERMKALALGQQLPDVALARTALAASQARAAGTIGVLVPLIMAGAAAGVTYLVFEQNYVEYQFALLCTLWGVCGVVSLVAVAVSLGVIAALRVREPEVELKSAAAPSNTDGLSASASEELRNQPREEFQS